MVLQNSDSKIVERGLGSSESDAPYADEKLKIVDSKQVTLSDSPNDSLGKSPAEDIKPIKLSGTKRAAPECSENSSQHRSPINNNANGQLVYVRRKSEADLSKSSSSDNINSKTEQSLDPKQIGQQSQPTQTISQIKEPKVSCLPAFAPIPMTSSVIPPGKPSVPQPVGVSASRSASAEPHKRPVAIASRNLEVLRNLHWEARLNRLQTLLKKLDQRPQDGYVNLLRQLTPRELSGQAVELEKRSMQLSLEEAKELQRVEALNMLVKPSKSSASQASARQGRQGK